MAYIYCSVPACRDPSSLHRRLGWQDCAKEDVRQRSCAVYVLAYGTQLGLITK